MPNGCRYPMTKASRCRRLAAATEHDLRETPEPSHLNHNCNHKHNDYQSTKRKMRFGHRRRNVAYPEQYPETKTEPEESRPYPLWQIRAMGRTKSEPMLHYPQRREQLRRPENAGKCGERIRTWPIRGRPSLWRETWTRSVTHVLYLGTGTATHADTQSGDMALKHQLDGVP